MKIKEIRELNVDEINTRRGELKQERFHLRIQQQSGQLEKPSRLKEIRRTIAQLETILTERRNQQQAKEAGVAKKA